MTIKQLIVGTLLGATAVAVVLHRLPKPLSTLAKLPAKQELKPASAAGRHAHRKHATDERLSSSKVFG